jgi:hypothetical protein
MRIAIDQNEIPRMGSGVQALGQQPFHTLAPMKHILSHFQKFDTTLQNLRFNLSRFRT